MTLPPAIDTVPRRVPRAVSDHTLKAGSAAPARRVHAPAWKCPRCGTRKRLRGDRTG